MINFDWFIKNLEKYGFNYSSLFLLEVRNYNWTSEQVSEYYKLIRYITSYVLKFKEKMNSLSITHIKHILTYMEKTINASFHEHKIQKYFTNIKNSFSM